MPPVALPAEASTAPLWMSELMRTITDRLEDLENRSVVSAGGNRRLGRTTRQENRLNEIQEQVYRI